MIDQSRIIYLSDYQPFSHLVERVFLTFRLDPRATEVAASLFFLPNPACPGRHDLRLDGEGLALKSLKLNDHPLDIAPDSTGLTIPATLLPDAPFTLETVVTISPETNAALEGLYMSRGMYCTQCEAEGFRKITFYPDRPDVMARFRVRIEADLPVLLSNGNPIGHGTGWAEWDDPWPKPAYLFALVAGDLTAYSTPFITASGLPVTLNIWVRLGDEDRCAYAIDCLIRSMRWDEQVYGREYDLSVFNIVAVDDFNMGAMENKGLNIFNSKFVLANPETATDDDFARIEAIIAHEYFHNWTGNRITCRDWFQLCLKEGLTVFRDRQFSGDMRSHAVKRIEDVLLLRARQFREDGGPLAHPVRPDNFVEINNFYTATVYEKGAELIGMLKKLVGDEAYTEALDLYFTRHDGEAATIEDWLKVFADVTGRDLTQFKRWYTEAGTPRVIATEKWDGETYSLILRQENPPTPGQINKEPKIIPVALGLLNKNGDEILSTTILELTKPEQTFTFPVATRPIASLLRGFSAPVVLERSVTSEECAFLLVHDTDPFNKWEAGWTLANDLLARMIVDGVSPSADWLNALARVVPDETLEPAFRALVLRLPSEDDMAATLYAAGITPDPARIWVERRRMADALAVRLAPELYTLIDNLSEVGPFNSDARAVGRRALRFAALSLLSRIDGDKAAAIYAGANNMTEEVGSLSCLLDIGQGADELQRFASRWSHDSNIMDKWFALQITYAAPDRAADVTDALTQHPAFDWKNPNRFRAVIGALLANHAGFHHASGSGYRLVAAWLLRLDPFNPQTAARMSTAFETWPRYDSNRRALIRMELDRIAATPSLSRNLAEMVDRIRSAS